MSDASLISCSRTKQYRPICRFVMLWDKNLKGTGSVLQQHGPPCLTVSQDNVERTGKVFQRGPHKFVHRAGSELGQPRSNVHNVFRKTHTTRLQAPVGPNWRGWGLPRRNVCLMKRHVMLCHVRHNCQVWGNANLRDVTEHEREVNVRCAVGTVFRSDGAPPHFSLHNLAFLDRSFLIVGQEAEDPFPSPPPLLQIWLLWTFSPGSL